MWGNRVSLAGAALGAALLAGCREDASVEHAGLRYLALGDSYTIGEGVAAEERFPAQLARALREAGLPVGDPEIIARTGWTASELARALDADPPRGRWDLVTLLIGVNDQYRGLPLDRTRAEIRGLIERAVRYAGRRPARVIVVSVPDWGVTPFAAGRGPERIAIEIEALNVVCRDEAMAAGAGWADVTPISRAAGAAPELLAPDGLHPSGAQYARWAGAILGEARLALAAR